MSPTLFSGRFADVLDIYAYKFMINEENAKTNKTVTAKLQFRP